MGGVLYGGRPTSFYDHLGWQLGGQGEEAPQERSYIQNGRFLHNLNTWNAAGGAVYSAGDGDDHYGVAVLPTAGGQIGQLFSVDEYRGFSLHFSVKPDGASAAPGQLTAAITDGAGNAVWSQNLSGTANTWTEQTYTVGLAQGTSYTLTIRNVSAVGNVKVDDVWLWWLPLTRAQIATRAHAKLSTLATSNNLTTTASGELTEGSYTYAIDAGLRAIGAINPVTDLPDIRQLETRLINDLLIAVEQEMLDVIERGQTTIVDIKVGQREEKLSQISANITRMRKR